MDGVSSAAPDGDNSRYSTDTISSKITIAPRLGFRSAIRHKSSIILDSISLRLSRDGFGSRRIKGGSPFVRSQSESPEKDKKRWYHSLRSRRSLTLESNDSANADPADAESEPPTSPTPFTPTKGFSHVVQSIRKRIRAEVAVDRAAHGGVEGILGSVPDKPARAPEIERPVARVELPSIVDRNNTFRMRTERAFQDIDTKYKFDNFILDTSGATMEQYSNCRLSIPAGSRTESMKSLEAAENSTTLEETADSDSTTAITPFPTVSWPARKPLSTEGTTSRNLDIVTPTCHSMHGATGVNKLDKVLVMMTEPLKGGVAPSMVPSQASHGLHLSPIATVESSNAVAAREDLHPAVFQEPSPRAATPHHTNVVSASATPAKPLGEPSPESDGGHDDDNGDEWESMSDDSTSTAHRASSEFSMLDRPEDDADGRSSYGTVAVRCARTMSRRRDRTAAQEGNEGEIGACSVVKESEVKEGGQNGVSGDGERSREKKNVPSQQHLEADASTDSELQGDLELAKRLGGWGV